MHDPRRPRRGTERAERAPGDPLVHIAHDGAAGSEQVARELAQRRDLRLAHAPALSHSHTTPPGRFVRARCEHTFVPAEATILHADADSFFASVEQRDDPRLRGKPVIVGAGVVLAASYEAKAFGVQSAMGGHRARRLCPKAIVVPPRMEAYVEASKAMLEVFDDTSPLVEKLSIDEAFLDVRGMERFAGTPTEIAKRLRRRVREQVGLPVTVGVACTKFLAKVASAVAKPDGLLVVPSGRELDFLHPLPVERLWGVGPVTAAQAARAAGSRPSPRWPSWRRSSSSRCSAARPAATYIRSRTTMTRAGCARAAGAAQWGRSTRLAGARRRAMARSTRCWSPSSTGSRCGCARRAAHAARSR